MPLSSLTSSLLTLGANWSFPQRKHFQRVDTDIEWIVFTDY